MIIPSDPRSGSNIQDWAQAVNRYLRDLDRRLNSILPQRPRSVEDTMPAKATLQPFQLVVSSSGGGTPTPMIRVIPSTLAGGSSTDLGFAEGDDPKYLLSPSEGVLVGGITFSTTTGEITSRWLEIMSAFPDPDTVADGTDYVEIGTVSQDPETGVWSAANSRYGPINAQICRNWYAAEAPFFGVNWS